MNSLLDDVKMPVRTLKAILWDNDGVLVNTEHLYYEATRATLERWGVAFTIEQYQEYFLRQGVGTRYLVARHGWSEEEFARFRLERGTAYSALLRKGVRPIDGVADVLARLHGRYVMGIVTSSQREHFDLIHAASGLRQYFEFALTAGEYPCLKPHPAPYLAGLARTGVAPDECIVIEDSERGLAAATAAGLRCVVVPSPLTVGADFRGAYRVLHDIRALPGIL
ncbi:MAG TPA: HAD family phosphatase [Burkholderiales bacterium]|nr:HAD family phosphatase [Burkholderiales bacterium]